MLKFRVRNSNGDAVPLGSFTTVSDISGPSRVPRYNLYPAAELDGSPRQATRKARPSTSCRSSQPRRCRAASAMSGQTLAFQQMRAGNTAVFAFALGVAVRVPGACRAIREPDAAARGHPHRAHVPHRLDHRRRSARTGQQHPDPGRLHRADRPCRQERHSDRRVRAPARGCGRDRFAAATEAAQPAPAARS